MPENHEVRKIIRLLLAEVLGGSELLGAITDDLPLRDAGVSSMALISLLASMEVEFGFEWDEEVDGEHLRTIDGLADYVAETYVVGAAADSSI